MKQAGSMLLLAVSLSLAAAGQQVGSAVPASYRIGPNDVLAMTVYGEPELSDPQMRVDQDGTIHTPYGKTPVEVGGMTPPAAGKAIAAELVRDQLAVDPQVEVRVVDPESHPIVISGEAVRRPGTIQAIQPLHLLDALTEAGGLSENNGAEIIVISHDAQGRAQERHYSAAAVMTATGTRNNPLLYGGEEVRVIPGGDAYLSGAVTVPGAYPLSSTDPLTVRKLLAKAHGLAAAARANDTQLIHHVGERDQTTTIIDLPGILNGTAPDIKLAANDMVYVPVSGSKKAGLEALSRTLQVLTLAGADLLMR